MTTAAATHHQTYMTTMTPDEWDCVPGNPRQRDTERRVSRARHLHSLEATHTLVHMAEWDGGRCKLEGHTRALIWKERPDIAPESIDVRVYIVEDEEEAKRLYGHFNSKEELEGVPDKLFGSLREHGISPQSCLVSGCRFTNAVRTAHTYATKSSNPTGGKKPPVHDGVAFFRDEIVAMDAMHFTKDKGIGCALCCYLLSRKKHGPRADGFFDRYIKDSGIKNGRSRDCVQAFTDAIDENRKQSGGGFTHFHDAVSVGLACIDRWMKDTSAMLMRSPKCDPYRYME